DRRTDAHDNRHNEPESTEAPGPPFEEIRSAVCDSLAALTRIARADYGRVLREHSRRWREGVERGGSQGGRRGQDSAAAGHETDCRRSRDEGLQASTAALGLAHSDK